MAGLRGEHGVLHWLGGAWLRPVRWRDINGPPVADEPIRIQIDCSGNVQSIAGPLRKALQDSCIGPGGGGHKKGEAGGFA